MMADTMSLPDIGVGFRFKVELTEEETGKVADASAGWSTYSGFEKHIGYYRDA